MKVLFSFLITCFLSATVIGQSTKGAIEYKLSTVMIDSSYKIIQNVDLFPGSYLHIYFMEKKTRLELNLEKGFKITLIADYYKDKGLRLFQSEKTKLAMECKASEAQLNQSTSGGERIELLNETKDILGYSCKKAIVRTDSTETVYWYTDQIKFNFSGLNIISSSFPGFPMQFSTFSNGMLMTFEAVKVENDIRDEKNIFSLDVPEGYILTDEESLKKAKK